MYLIINENNGEPLFKSHELWKARRYATSNSQEQVVSIVRDNLKITSYYQNKPILAREKILNELLLKEFS